MFLRSAIYCALSALLLTPCGQAVTQTPKPRDQHVTATLTVPQHEYSDLSEITLHVHLRNATRIGYENAPIWDLGKAPLITVAGAPEVACKKPIPEIDVDGGPADRFHDFFLAPKGATDTTISFNAYKCPAPPAHGQVTVRAVLLLRDQKHPDKELQIFSAPVSINISKGAEVTATARTSDSSLPGLVWVQPLAGRSSQTAYDDPRVKKIINAMTPHGFAKEFRLTMTRSGSPRVRIVNPIDHLKEVKRCLQKK